MKQYWMNSFILDVLSCFVVVKWKPIKLHAFADIQFCYAKKAFCHGFRVLIFGLSNQLLLFFDKNSVRTVLNFSRDCL